MVEIQGHRGRSPEPQPGGSAAGGGQLGVKGEAAKKCLKRGKGKHRSTAAAAKKNRTCGKRKRKR